MKHQMVIMNQVKESLRYSTVAGEILYFVQNDQFGVSLAIFVAMPLCLPVPLTLPSPSRGEGFIRLLSKTTVGQVFLTHRKPAWAWG